MYLIPRVVIFALILLSHDGIIYAQNPVFVNFPKTSTFLILPDSTFQLNHNGSGFYSNKHKAKIDMDKEAEVNNYEFLVDALRLEFSKPGIEVLFDTSMGPQKKHLFKVKIEFDITDLSPNKRGRIGILWICLLNSNETTLIFTGEYQQQEDSVLHQRFKESFVSIKDQ